MMREQDQGEEVQTHLMCCDSHSVGLRVPMSCQGWERLNAEVSTAGTIRHLPRQSMCFCDSSL